MTNLIVVSGAPATGKSTVAIAVAGALGWPLIMKDTIKEALGGVLGAVDLEASRRLGAATYEVMYSIAARTPLAVLESNFAPSARERLLGLHPAPVEIFCHCAPETAMSRYRARHRAPVHFDDDMLDDIGERLAVQEPLALGGALLRVDTTCDVDMTSVVSWVKQAIA